MTALNCKVGDLAIVVNTELSQNLGQIVEVLGLPPPAPIGLTGKGHIWQVRVVSGRATLYYRHNYGNRPTKAVIDGGFVQMSTRGRSKPNATRQV